MIQIIEMLIPKHNTFTRPGIKMKPTSITIHETDNTNVRANALAHAKLQVNGNPRQASWHLQVDDEPEVYLSIPLNEVAYHAGNRKGNYSSIAIEICVNRDGSFKKAVHNATEVVRYLMKKYPSIKKTEVVQHHYWSGKNCPRNLRKGTSVSWNTFLKMINQVSPAATLTPSHQHPHYTTTNNSFAVGSKVRLKQTATNYATGEKIPNHLKGRTYTIQQRGSNRMLLKELYSWVITSDLVVPNEGKVSATGKQKSQSLFTIGSKVKLNNSAKQYATGEIIPNHIKGKTYTVQQIKKNKVLLKEIYSWVNTADVTVVSSTSANRGNTPKKSPIFFVGKKVKLKQSAKTYSRAIAAIPVRYKGKTFTIQQVGNDDVLLKELYSWVRKNDVE